MTKIPIKFGSLSAVLKLLGSLYRNPADAIKEHVSNAVDEYLKIKDDIEIIPSCNVQFTIERDKVIIEYPFGMSRDEFKDALQSVAESAKTNLDIKQIGQIGIGIFSFFQIGRKCVFFSRKSKECETIKVTLKEGSDDAEFDTALKRERLKEPGIRIIIYNLLFDPTKPRGPLSPTKLQRVFSEKFNPYLQDGSLKISIKLSREIYTVKPLKIDLPSIGESYKDWPIEGDFSRKFSLELYFDASGKATVSIRHMGVTIVDDIRTLSAYGLEESIFASGYVRGFIDADFLKPLPARTNFEENNDWDCLLIELDRLCPSIESAVDNLRQEEEQKKLTELQKKAIELAKDILNLDEFKDLELLEGLGRKQPTERIPPNGFDFVPASIRIEIGETGNLPFKAIVPAIVPDNSLVKFQISDSSFVELKTDEAIINSYDADKNGVVTKHVYFLGKRNTTVPILLNAKVGNFNAEARIRVSPTVQKRISPESGLKINYEELPFEDGPSKHSRYVSKKIQVNQLNKDYIYETQIAKSEQSAMAYSALMVGKETIAFNDKSGYVDDFLEKILSFYFELKNRIRGVTPVAIKRPRGRPRKNI